MSTVSESRRCPYCGSCHIRQEVNNVDYQKGLKVAAALGKPYGMIMAYTNATISYVCLSCGNNFSFSPLDFAKLDYNLRKTERYQSDINYYKSRIKSNEKRVQIIEKKIQRGEKLSSDDEDCLIKQKEWQSKLKEAENKLYWLMRR